MTTRYHMPDLGRARTEPIARTFADRATRATEVIRDFARALGVDDEVSDRLAVAAARQLAAEGLLP